MKKGLDVPPARLDRPLNKVGLAAAPTAEGIVQLLDKAPQISPQLANGIFVSPPICTGEAGAPPAAGVEYRVAQSAQRVGGQAVLKEKNVTGPGVQAKRGEIERFFQ